ncbi:hypothetical protein K8O96_03010 [Clostridium sporogenes]|uniref:Phage protein n=1 Tax=Clostridium botulinum TaxID=1491 RepID=A0A6M0T0Z5_CLOBO|nr:hypothetical protein [Clostridium sporogenes]NFA60815.1 hypothetical protein [Clostridium botulinum]NFI72512.1 hypothetical protein [Clostridium sporogenes]NFL73483.1 hypothetical protein [Clostridium sporogenes]NFM23590.1 hypothetical protein [Clostridium sporogenes]NFP60640.1 hypothetical protein [Clostridium sporogenes]
MIYGRRIIFDKQTGFIINKYIDVEGNINKKCRPDKIDFIDVSFNGTPLENAEEYHVDINNKEIVIDKYKEHTETQEEKLIREKQELENQLLLKQNKETGGIL